MPPPKKGLSTARNRDGCGILAVVAIVVYRDMWPEACRVEKLDSWAESRAQQDASETIQKIESHPDPRSHAAGGDRDGDRARSSSPSPTTVGGSRMVEKWRDAARTSKAVRRAGSETRWRPAVARPKNARRRGAIRSRFGTMTCGQRVLWTEWPDTAYQALDQRRSRGVPRTRSAADNRERCRDQRHSAGSEAGCRSGYRGERLTVRRRQKLDPAGLDAGFEDGAVRAGGRQKDSPREARAAGGSMRWPAPGRRRGARGFQRLFVAFSPGDETGSSGRRFWGKDGSRRKSEIRSTSTPAARHVDLSSNSVRCWRR